MCALKRSSQSDIYNLTFTIQFFRRVSKVHQLSPPPPHTTTTNTALKNHTLSFVRDVIFGSKNDRTPQQRNENEESCPAHQVHTMVNGKFYCCQVDCQIHLFLLLAFPKSSQNVNTFSKKASAFSLNECVMRF